MLKEDIRQPFIAGSWYPGDPGLLRATIDDFLSKVPSRIPGKDIVGIIVPHAGYIYSGQVAAYAYKCLEGSTYETVIVIGPSHRAHFEGVSVYSRGGYETPLGVARIDETLSEAMMAASGMIKSLPKVHLQEHAIEIQLPFIQMVLGDVRFVPLIMGDQKPRTCEALSETIAKAVRGQKVLVVGSSDLSHFHDYNAAKRMDGLILKRLALMEARGLMDDLEAGLCESCGGGPMATTIMAAKNLGAAEGEMLCYANSGDTAGDKDSVVGYTAAMYYRGRDETKHLS